MTKIHWSNRARLDVRAIDRVTAMQILGTIDQFARFGIGEVKHLRPPLKELRLRSGDWRVFFEAEGSNAIRITRILHRSQAYR
ncbi:MAG: type II toxin-antitoxin system RelE family toxin [Bryobacteraceae bacterium]